ncbi:MAG: CopG family transcriptional regulator [Pseudomonadota bacterium]
MKPRIHTYISETNFVRLHAEAKKPGQSLWSVVDDALKAYLGGDADRQKEALVARRLDRLTRQFDRLERNDTVLGETLALFIRYFLMVTPQLPANQLDAARAKGDQQFDQFLEQLGRDLQSGKRLLQRAVDDVIADETSFFSEEDLDRLHRPAPEGSTRSPIQKDADHA